MGDEAVAFCPVCNYRLWPEQIDADRRHVGCGVIVETSSLDEKLKAALSQLAIADRLARSVLDMSRCDMYVIAAEYLEGKGK